MSFLLSPSPLPAEWKAQTAEIQNKIPLKSKVILMRGRPRPLSFRLSASGSKWWKSGVSLLCTHHHSVFVYIPWFSLPFLWSFSYLLCCRVSGNIALKPECLIIPPTWQPFSLTSSLGSHFLSPLTRGL